MTFSFPKKCHLVTKQHFQEVFRNPQKISGVKFALFVKPNKLSFSRLGIIIAKKAVAKAVDRNRIKRLVRESFRLHQYAFKGKDVIFLAYKGLDAISNEDLKKCLEKKWPREK